MQNFFYEQTSAVQITTRTGYYYYWYYSGDCITYLNLSNTISKLCCL